MRYRICDHVQIVAEGGENDIYRKFKHQFDSLFTSDIISTNDENFEELYVPDDLFETALSNFLNSIHNSMRFCVGYTGIGKTTSIRHCLNLGVSNVTSLTKKSYRSPDKYMIIFPTFFDGTRKKAPESFDIAAVCTTLEETHPELRDVIHTTQGRKSFYRFIRNHTPRILETKDNEFLTNLPENEEIKIKLGYAQKKHQFEYYANKLKYYIKCKYSVYDRLVILLDDVETLPERQQDLVIEAYLQLFECMNNTDFPDDSEYRINLLVSIRPHTLRLYQKCEFNTIFRRLEAFSIVNNTVLKKNAIDLSYLFEKRFQHYTKFSKKEIKNKDSWDDCYKELKNLNNAFDGKYKDMILNLCFMNVREALATYSRIFANRFWIQGNRLKEAIFTVNSREYTFNNINIIRSIGCNNSAIFTGTENSVIPNIFLSSENEDYSIYCLLVMRYFLLYEQKKEATQEVTYGLNAQKLGTICQQWSAIVDSDCKEKFYNALVYLFEKKVLRKSLEDVDDIESIDTEASLCNDSKLYMSPRGYELMAMLGRDSVFLEMLRECTWRDYEGHEDFYSRQSSYELLIQREQYKIFLDLLEYIDYLREEEEKIFFKPNKFINLVEYKDVFGSSMIVLHLLQGVKNSLNYSGIINMPVVSKKTKQVEDRINESSRKLN